MGVNVLRDISHLPCRVNKKNLCGVSDAVDCLFHLYIVCYIKRRERKRRMHINVIV